MSVLGEPRGRRSPSRRVAMLGVLVSLLAGACVSADDPGVAVTDVQADLVFGIEEPPEAALPANTAAGPIPVAAQTGGFDVEALVAPPFRNPAADRLPPLVGPQAPSECPSAPPTAAAELVAEAEISGPVREGIYRWQRDGVQTIPVEGGDPQVVEVSGFEKRIIRNVRPADDPLDEGAYTFEMVQALVDRPVVQVRTFLVKPRTQAQVRPGAGGSVIDPPRANEPEGGISLVKIDEFDEDDSRLSAFEPAVGLLYLGLPVDPSETFETAATDPKTGQTIVQAGQVVNRARVDACGELVDGWRVETTQTRSDTPGEVLYNYLVAPQYGGVLIQEEITTTAPDGTRLDLVLTLGQIDPDPLPAG